MRSRGTIAFDREELRRRRIAAGLLQAKLAAEAGHGITQRYISDLERGYHGPTADKLAAIAAALPDCTADDLQATG